MPDGFHHLGIIDAGADKRAEPRVIEQQPQRCEHDDAGDQHEQPIVRIEDAEHMHAAAQQLRDRHRKAVAAPDHQRQIVEHECDAQRQQHLAQLVAAHEAQQALVEHETDRGDGCHGADAAEHETAGR